MSDKKGCLGKKCKDCPDVIVKLGKVVCNRENRLGLRKGKVEDFFGGESE